MFCNSTQTILNLLLLLNSGEHRRFYFTWTNRDNRKISEQIPSPPQNHSPLLIAIEQGASHSTLRHSAKEGVVVENAQPPMSIKCTKWTHRQQLNGSNWIQITNPFPSLRFTLVSFCRLVYSIIGEEQRKNVSAFYNWISIFPTVYFSEYSWNHFPITGHGIISLATPSGSSRELSLRVKSEGRGGGGGVKDKVVRKWCVTIWWSLGKSRRRVKSNGWIAVNKTVRILSKNN